MSSNEDGGNRKKRALTPSLDQSSGSPLKKSKQEVRDTLSPLLDPNLANVRQSIFGNLSIEEGMRLGQASKGWNAVVITETQIPNLTGVRNNTKTGQRFWTTDSTASEKRYFKPMSPLGVTSDAPHISEQTGHPSHATDVGTQHWASSGSGNLPPGLYPTKVQFAGPVDARPPYVLGPINIPARADGGRVLVPAPPVANEKPNTLIPTRDYNRALDVPSKGPLPASRQRTIVSTQEASKPISHSRSGWEGARITGRDKLR